MSELGLICLMRTQDLESKDDEYCVECFHVVHHVSDGTHYWLIDWYADRQECIAENCVTEEEYIEIQKNRQPDLEPKSLSAFDFRKVKGA